MKRSTIALLIFLAVMIFVPIIGIKIISHLSPEMKIESLKNLLNESDEDAPVRYLIIDNDTTTHSENMLITISTRDKKDSRQGITLIGGQENYSGDTLHITGQWLGQSSADDTEISVPQSWLDHQTLDYDYNTRLIVENHNPNVSLHVPFANFERLTVQSPGKLVVERSNMGILVVQDSIGYCNTDIRECNIGTLFAYLNNKCSLALANNNIGSAFFPRVLDGLSLVRNNIGVTGTTELMEFKVSKTLGNDSTDAVSLGVNISYTNDDKEDKE